MKRIAFLCLIACCGCSKLDPVKTATEPVNVSTPPRSSSPQPSAEDKADKERERKTIEFNKETQRRLWAIKDNPRKPIPFAHNHPPKAGEYYFRDGGLIAKTQAELTKLQTAHNDDDLAAIDSLRSAGRVFWVPPNINVTMIKVEGSNTQVEFAGFRGWIGSEYVAKKDR